MYFISWSQSSVLDLFLILHILVELSVFDVMEVEHVERFKWELNISLGNENTKLLC